MKIRGLKLALAATVCLASLGVSVVPSSAANIVEVAQSNGHFATLLKAAKAAGLVGALSAPGDKTLFAPTDAAFAKIPKKTLASLLLPKNKSKLKAILLYHVVGGKTILAKGIAPGTSHVRTLEGGSLTIRKHATVRVDGATVVTADVKADNGVIHVINRVLMPK